MNTARWWAIVLLSILVTPEALAQDQRQVDEGSVTLVSDPFGPWEGYVNGSSTMSMEHLRWWIEDGNAVLIHPPQHFSAVVPVADRWDWVIDLTTSELNGTYVLHIGANTTESTVLDHPIRIGEGPFGPIVLEPSSTTVMRDDTILTFEWARSPGIDAGYNAEVRRCSDSLLVVCDPPMVLDVHLDSGGRAVVDLALLGLDEGSHVLSMQITDSYLRRSNQQAIPVLVDRSPPMIDLRIDEAIIEGQPTTYDATGSEDRTQDRSRFSSIWTFHHESGMMEVERTAVGEEVRIIKALNLSGTWEIRFQITDGLGHWNQTNLSVDVIDRHPTPLLMSSGVEITNGTVHVSGEGIQFDGSMSLEPSGRPIETCRWELDATIIHRGCVLETNVSLEGALRLVVSDSDGSEAWVEVQMEPASTSVDETNSSSTVWIALALIVLTITALLLVRRPPPTSVPVWDGA